VLLAGLILTFAGCGKTEPTPQGGQSADPKGSNPSGTAAEATTSQPGSPTSSATLIPALLPPQDPIQKSAEAFISDLMTAAANPGPFPADLLNRVSPTFLKVIGKPILSPAATAKGYSPEAAEGWLRRAGAGLAGLSPPTGYGSSTGAVFVGSVHNGAGRFLLRMSPEEGGWKVAWFQLGSAKTGESPKPSSPFEPFEDFAALAFLDSITGVAALPKDERMLLLGAILSPKLRAEWGEPFEQDKSRGYDFSPSNLGRVADAFSDPNGSYSRTLTGPVGEFKVELTKGGSVKAWTLKLVKGQTPGEWLVDEFKQS
jgi:hypothetical protein